MTWLKATYLGDAKHWDAKLGMSKLLQSGKSLSPKMWNLEAPTSLREPKIFQASLSMYIVFIRQSLTFFRNFNTVVVRKSKKFHNFFLKKCASINQNSSLPFLFLQLLKDDFEHRSLFWTKMMPLYVPSCH